MAKKLKKVLVANRGEIAVRIMRACREMDIPSVAVYSDVDRKSLHVQMADEAIHIGESSPSESYLNVDKLMDAAKQTGADSLHPGYGFLAENADFAERCHKEGLIFIGPSPDVIRTMGSKLRSREMMQKAGVPVTPGMTGDGGDLKAMIKEADKVGYPVIVKASSGGGGKGMRSVFEKKELKAAIEGAMREAKSAFGDETVYIEKLIQEPRHIEFQVLADQHGNTVHLFERECSIQRRHQKVIEETPSPALNDKLRADMGKAAVMAAERVGYTNAGTVEFMLDKDGKFYFLEMNTRIQVEHPVTEMTTGVDLLKWQLRIAAGEKLTLKQDEISQRGHSIECRVYAEDPENNFMPAPGKILFMQEPSGPNVRNDCGIYAGWDVPLDYDPILSKLVVWDEDRSSAIAKMIKALDDYVLLGIRHNIAFLKDVLRHPAFCEGKATTHFIEDNMSPWKPQSGNGSHDEALIAAALATVLAKPMASGSSKAVQPTPWDLLGEWQIGDRL